MTALILVILAAFGVLLMFLGFFVWGVKSGQFEDLDTPAKRILLEDLNERKREEVGRS